MIEVGQTYRSTLDVVDEDGVPANPATATYTVTLPDLTTATAPVTLPPAITGHLVADYVTTVAGPHSGKWVTTAPGIPKTDAFTVREYRSLLGLDEARNYLGVLDKSRDEILRAKLGGMTREVERYVGTCVPKVITAEFIPGSRRATIRLPSGPALSATAVTSIVSVWASGPAWVTADLDAAGSLVWRKDGQPFTGGPWRWSGTAGRLVIPDDVLEGAKLALWELWADQRGISADTTEPSMSEVSDYETAVPSNWRLSPRVMQLLDGEHMPGFA